jgi:hypothetical protein
MIETHEAGVGTLREATYSGRDHLGTASRAIPAPELFYSNDDQY